MLQTFKRESSTSEIAGALARDGAAIVEDFLAAEKVDRLFADFVPHLDAAEWSNTGKEGPDAFFGFKTKRLHGLLARSGLFGEIMIDPLLMANGLDTVRKAPPVAQRLLDYSESGFDLFA